MRLLLPCPVSQLLEFPQGVAVDLISQRYRVPTLQPAKMVVGNDEYGYASCRVCLLDSQALYFLGGPRM
jgi:hypothetical protein